MLQVFKDLHPLFRHTHKKSHKQKMRMCCQVVSIMHYAPYKYLNLYSLTKAKGRPTRSTTFTMTPHFRHVFSLRPATRIRKNARPSHIYVDLLTLKILGSQARNGNCAQARRRLLPKARINQNNAKDVTTQVLFALTAKKRLALTTCVAGNFSQILRLASSYDNLLKEIATKHLCKIFIVLHRVTPSHHRPVFKPNSHERISHSKMNTSQP